MKSNSTKKFLIAGCATLLFAAFALAQEHKWAGRELNELESTIHARLAVLPAYGVFDTLNFEVQGETVRLSGQVVNEKVSRSAERAVRQLTGVGEVVNQIEVLPSSDRDDALRMNVYRAIYEEPELAKYGTRAVPPIHIVVKDGWVTLEGIVDSETDRSKAHLLVLKVTPHVTDNLRVPRES